MILGVEDPLSRAYPAAGLSPLPLLALPTPVEPAGWLGPGCWIKRDDLIARDGGYGGSKLRKLAYILAHEPDQRPLTLLGPTGSNWLYAAARLCVARQRPLRVHPFQAHPYPGWRVKHDALRALVPTSAPGSPTAAAARVALDLLRGHRLLPLGGSDALGALAYVSAAFELAAQIEAGALPAPRRIVVAYGSGGTAVGLAVGAYLAGLRCELTAVRVNERAVANPWVARGIARAALRRLGLPGGQARRALARLSWHHGAFGGRYGRPTAAGQATLAAAASAGVRLDPVYSGKAAAAMMADPTLARDALLWQTYCPLDPSPAGAAGVGSTP